LCATTEIPQSLQPSSNKPATNERTNQTGTNLAANQTGTNVARNQLGNTTTTGQFTTSTSPPLSALHNSICLLKTAIADISAGVTTVEGHILFDEGAQRSFIAQELANSLQLQPPRHELILVSTFGAQVSMPKKFAVATICIHTLNSAQIPVSVLIVPRLATPVCNSTCACLSQLP